MAKNQRSSEAAPKDTKAACVHCGQQDMALRFCRLTGMGDHPRHFYLCLTCWNAMVEKSPGARLSPEHPTMSEAQMRRETRRQKALDRLGTDNPVCACCSETDPACLELHHLEGEDFGATLVTVCRNCHRKLSEAQKDHPAQLGEKPQSLETIGHFLAGLADLLVLLANKLREFAEYIIDYARIEPTTVR